MSRTKKITDELKAFDQAIGKLKELSSKPLDKFHCSSHPAPDIEGVASFLHRVISPRTMSVPKGKKPISDATLGELFTENERQRKRSCRIS